MAFGDTVNSAKVSLASGECIITFPAATAGNLLIVGEGRSATHSATGTWVPDSAGWATLTDSGINVGNMSGAWYYKIAAGGETGFTSAHSLEQGNLQAVYAEFEGPFAASPLDVTAEDAANLASVVTSQGTGTTGTTAQADALAIAFFATDRFDTVDGTPTYSDSFTQVIIGDTSSARASAFLAKRVLSATGTYTCTRGCTDTGDEMYGAIAVFKKASSGYTLDMAQGSYTLSGQALGLTAQHTIALAQGSYALTGQALALLRGLVLALAQGSYALSGQDLALLAARTLAMNQGSYTLSGQAVGLDYSAAAPTPIVHQGGIGLLDPDRSLAWKMLTERARRKRDEEEMVIL
jgi:hypothetical protein